MITPQTTFPDIAREVGVQELYLKREDLHPYGSHKGRSIPVMIDRAVAASATTFALSSSGNAALAAIRHIQYLNSTGKNLSLSIFIGKNISKEKKDILTQEISDPRITLAETERPLQTFLNFIRGTNVVSLRQSTDDTALIGYKTLAHELLTIPNLTRVYIASSSGTTAQALAQYFKESGKAISVVLVQTSETYPLAELFTKNHPAVPEKSLADAIVDRVAHRRDTIQKLFKTTLSTGVIADNTTILRAQNILKTAGIVTTANGALSLAGLLIDPHKKDTEVSVCIITGK